MRAALALLSLLALAACDPDTTGHDVRTQAIAMRNEVNAASDIVKAVSAYVPFACNLLGDDSPKCDALHASHEAISASIDAAHIAIDAYDSTGIMLAGADKAATGMREAANAFAVKVLAAMKAAQDGLENVAGESRGDDRGQAAQPAPAPETAPVAGSSAPAPSAAAE